MKHIGVSNYTCRHLQDLLDHCTVKPHVHQFELHPCLLQRDILELCQKNGIQVQAYSSLGEGRLVKEDIIPSLSEMAARYGKSKAQVLLRWAVQHGWTVIPKSSSADRVKENADIFSFNLKDEVVH